MLCKKIVHGAAFAWRRILKKPVYINLNIVSTNLCTQKCPMCNAELDHSSELFTLEKFKFFMEKIKPYHFLSCTISGGEPTMVKEMPQIVAEAVKHFPFSVSMITNLYGSSPLFYEIIDAVLKNHVHISVSFDGFGETADRLRGAKNVSERVMKNIEYVNAKKKEFKSRSRLTLHTVVSDTNLPQIKEIHEYSKKIGWNYTIAPVVNFFYQDLSNPLIPRLSDSPELREVVEMALSAPNMHQQKKFLKGMLYYRKKKAPKLCPYLVPHLRNYKIFLEPDGSIYLCNRTSLGTLYEKPLHEMFQGPAYEASLKEYRACEGCWLECFVSPMLYSSMYPEIKKWDFDLKKLN